MGDNFVGVYFYQRTRTGFGDVKNRLDIRARSRIKGAWFALVFWCFLATFSFADSVRVATFNVSLGRRGPGVLLKAIASGEDAQVAAVTAIIQRVRPDVLLLNEFDHDYLNLALTKFSKALAAGDSGIIYPHFFARAGNEGVPSGADLDENGRLGEWADARGFGRFPGSEGMALLSRFPIDTQAARSFNAVTWGAVPAALSSKSHWDVPIKMPDGRRLNVLASHPTPPVFDGPENLNGRRNAAEIMFWVSYLNGAEIVDDADRRARFEGSNFVLMGDLNNDPIDGEGDNAAIQALLGHRLVQDVQQRSEGAKIAAARLGGANSFHVGDPAFDTVEWGADIGNMRVDYALPSVSLEVVGGGVFWPRPSTLDGHMIAEGREGASNHRLVWVDVVFD